MSWWMMCRFQRKTTFLQHLHTAHRQNHQFGALKDQLKPTEVLLVMDFAENRKSSYQDEIKSAHFSKQQITLHPVIAFYRDGQGNLVRHAVNFVSDDTVHGHHAVHHFTEIIFRQLTSKGVMAPNTEVYIYSDGCAAQYKGKWTFADPTHLLWGRTWQRRG